MYLSIYLPIYLSIYLPIYLSTYPPIYLSTYLPIYLSTSLSLSVCLPVCLSIYVPVYLQAWKRSCSARLPQVVNLTTSKTRDFLNVWTWQRQKRSSSARLHHFSKLTTSKTKQFCETSSTFQLDNVKNEAILRDFLNISTWQRQKPSNSARLPHFSKLTTSKTKEFCKTSFKNRKVQSWRPRTNVCYDFSNPSV